MDFELLPHPDGAERGEGEQQAAFRPEALHQGRRRDARLARDVGERQIRAEPDDHPVGGGEQVLVGERPRA